MTVTFNADLCKTTVDTAKHGVTDGPAQPPAARIATRTSPERRCRALVGVTAVAVGVSITTAACGSSSTTPSTAPPTPAATPAPVAIKFVNHLQAMLPEQDVFLAAGTPGQVVRVEGDAGTSPANLAKAVYATATVTPHDPFKVGPAPLGPFSKGAPLGFTLGQWLAATGSGTYTVDGSTADLRLSLANLVPNGTYTLWCSRLTFPPHPAVVDEPCGAADGSQNRISSDGAGNASYHLTLPPLLPSSKETASVIALAYHSDGKSYGAAPGDFGLHTHIQLFFLLPVPLGA